MAGYSTEKLPEPLRDFLAYMQSIRGMSERTVNGYFFDLRTFLRFILQLKKKVADTVPFDEIDISEVDVALIGSVTLSDIYEFLNYSFSERENQAATRARKVSALRSFYKYLTAKAGLLKDNPVAELDSPKQRKSLPRYLDLNECLMLLQAVSGEHQQRDYAMIVIFLNTGIRLSELVGINLSDIRDNELRVIGKGNKERTVYLAPACIDAINEYMRVRPVDGVIDKKALFLSAQKKRISNRMVELIIKKHIENAGLDPQRYSVHKLRHTAATLMYRNGVDVRVLQEVLGHTNLGTTQIYTHLDDTQIKQAADANPLGHVKPKKQKSFAIPDAEQTDNKKGNADININDEGENPSEKM